MTSAFGKVTGYAVELVNSIKSTVAGTGKTVKGLIIVIVTTLLNKLGNKEFFKCPKEKHGLAGWLFIIIPAFILGALILMASDKVSQGAILCGNRSKNVKRRQNRACFFMHAIALALGYSVLAALSWIVASLLFTETYACIKLGPAPDTKNATKLNIYNSMKDSKDATSKVIGLILLTVAIAFQMVLFFYNKCCLTDLSHIEKRLACEDSYFKKEAEAAMAAFEQLVENSSKINGEKVVIDLVPEEYAKKGRQGEEDPQAKKKLIPKNKPDSKSESEEESDSEQQGIPEAKPTIALPREDVLALRKKLIDMYPRLDNPLDWNLEYWNPKYGRVTGTSRGEDEEEGLLEVQDEPC